MRLGLSLLLVSSFVPMGCFEDPPSSSSDSGGTADSTQGDATATSGEATGSTEVGSTTSAGATGVATTGVATTDVATTGGPSGSELLLFPLTCTEAEWQSNLGTLECDRPRVGPFLDTHESYTFAGQSFARVIEVRPPEMPDAAVDGIYEIDTSGFENPEFRSQVACVAKGGCTINFAITSEVGGKIQSDPGGNVSEGDDIVQVAFGVPTDSELVIHLNVSSPMIIGESRFLWIDPRVVEADQ